MKTVLAILVLVVAAGCGGTKTVTKTVTVEGPAKAELYGHIKSLTRTAGGVELQFDPAWLLSGTAAEHAAVQDKVLEPGEPVPNDNYTVEAGHRLLTFVVAPTAHVALVGKSLRPVTVPVAELVQILAGENPKHRPLFSSSANFGFWIQIGQKYPNPVIALEQQYHP